MSFSRQITKDVVNDTHVSNYNRPYMLVLSWDPYASHGHGRLGFDICIRSFVSIPQ